MDRGKIKIFFVDGNLSALKEDKNVEIVNYLILLIFFTKQFSCPFI